MRILGVDPGSLRTGWGLIGGDPGHPSLLECGVIRLRSPGAFAERLHFLQIQFEALVTRTAPTAAAVETPFHGTNARAAFQLAHARGVLLSVLGGVDVPVAEYSPATVKKAVTGNGRAEKAQVQAMIARLLGFDGRRSPTDVADALAVAVCHASSLGYRLALDCARTSRNP